MTTMAFLDNAKIREMPSALDVEGGLIGGVLMRNDNYQAVADIVQTEHFRDDLHRRIWRVITSTLGEKGSPADIKTIHTVLGDRDIGGMTLKQYLARQVAESPPAASMREYARIVRDMAQRRRIIEFATDALDAAYDPPPETTLESIIADFEDNLSVLRLTTNAKTDFEGFEEVSLRALAEAEEAYQRGPGLVGLSTGFNRLDDALGGLQRTDLIVLGGRPGAGKTALATNMALSAARALHQQRKEGGKTGVVGFFSLEMRKEQLARRIFSETSGVPDWKVKRGFATEDEMRLWIDAQRELAKIPLFIDDTSGLSIGGLRTRARNLKKRRGLDLIVVDYLQLLTGAGKDGVRKENRTQEVSEISAGLKGLAKELNVPVLALAQLSRQVETRDDKRPMLADLRESGSIEQDADQVLFLFREEYYLQKQKQRNDEEFQRRLHEASGVAEIIIGKNRHGPEGVVELGFDAQLTKFLNEPIPRSELAMPEPEYQPKQPKRLPVEATILLGLLKGASNGCDTFPIRIPTEEERRLDRNLKKTARLIPALKMREVFGKQMGIYEDGKELEKKFREAMKALRAAGIAYWSGSKNDPTVWLPELVEE